MRKDLKKIFENINDEDLSKARAKYLIRVHKKVENNLYSSGKVFDIVSNRMIEDIMEENEF